MNKTEAINQIAEETGIKKYDVAVVVDTFISKIEETVATGERFSIQGFGSFDRKVLDEREGRNPATGEALVLPESAYPKFSSGASFKDKVKEAFLG